MAADTNKISHRTVLRSPLGRARGLGSAQAGSSAWWIQRITAMALTVLSLWFIASVIALKGASRDAMVAWLSAPASLVLMIALVLATFHHMQVGLQVVIEDYVRAEGGRILVLLVSRAFSVALALGCIVAVLKLGLQLAL